MNTESEFLWHQIVIFITRQHIGQNMWRGTPETRVGTPGLKVVCVQFYSMFTVTKFFPIFLAWASNRQFGAKIRQQSKGRESITSLVRMTRKFTLTKIRVHLIRHQFPTRDDLILFPVIRCTGLSWVSTACDLNRGAKWRKNMAARKQVGRVRNRNRHCYLTYDQNFRNLWHNESNRWPSIFLLTVTRN